MARARCGLGCGATRRRRRGTGLHCRHSSPPTDANASVGPRPAPSRPATSQPSEESNCGDATGPTPSRPAPPVEKTLTVRQASKPFRRVPSPVSSCASYVCLPQDATRVPGLRYQRYYDSLGAIQSSNGHRAKLPLLRMIFSAKRSFVVDITAQLICFNLTASQ